MVQPYFFGNLDGISDVAVATGVRTKTFLWVRSAHPQKCPKHNGYGYMTISSDISEPSAL